MEDTFENPPKTVAIRPLGGKLDCELHIPGGKSMANRVLLLAGMAEGTTDASGIPDGDDSLAALSVLNALGIRTERLSDDTYRIHGCGHIVPNRSAELDIGSAGTVGRFLPGLLASAPDGEWRLVSTPQLAGRPLGPLLDSLRAWGADVTNEAEGKSFPLRIRATGLAGGDAAISAAASSQFASGLMMAAPYAKRDARIGIAGLDPQELYIGATVEAMRHFGAEVETEQLPDRLAVSVAATGKYLAKDICVEADLNAALNFLALPLLAGGNVRVSNVDGTTRQPGRQLLALFPSLGAAVEKDKRGVRISSDGGKLRGGFDLDMRAMSESALLLAVLAVNADAPVAMTNLGHIRNHETDRLEAISQLLHEFGVATEEGPDWVRVHPFPRERLKTPTIDSRGDHRVVMAFTLLALAGNGATITNADAVSKTFPRFFQKLRQIGADITAIE